MKVLFAVNSESVSDAIIKKYQKDYREILSYKNVYYFNAIQKEIQKDKSYDRIIISEDLEPFSNNNYESIDKFIFEKLDGISDEAHDSQGNEISIILICSDRHTKGSSFLVKLFGIGVYNALLGNDRSMEEVCRLINKPRTKKEAKMYYKIDTDDVNYRAENENEVSELEIQNIIAHFKKLGKNAEKYVSSFENIASQYTDEQLKIIINCLPINVKAILEESSNKYQEIMSVNGTFVRGVKSKNTATRQDQKRTGLKIDIIENKMNQTKMTKPIVIPNSVKPTRSATAKKVMSVQPNTQVAETVKPQATRKVQQTPPNRTVQRNRQEIDEEQLLQKRVEPKKKVMPTEQLINGKKVVKRPIQRQPIDEDEMLIKKSNATVAKSAPTQDVSKTVKPMRKTVNNPTKKLNDEHDPFDELEDIELPDLDFGNEILKNDAFVDSNIEEIDEIEPVKKRRGRPRKNPVAEEAPKPKGKRGRPRKNPIEESILDDEEDDFDMLISNSKEQPEANSYEDETLPDLETQEWDETEFDDLIDTDEQELVDFEDDETFDVADEEFDSDEMFADEVSLPELDELDDVNDFDDEEDYDTATEESFDEFEDYDEYGEYETKAQSNFANDNVDELYDEDILAEDDALPGYDLLDDETEEYEEYEEEPENNLLSDLEEDDDLLSAVDYDDDEFELGNDDEELAYQENDFADTNDFNNMQNDFSNTSYDDQEDFDYGNGALESIGSTIDYSMSNLNSLMTKDKKIVTFVGSPKNGVSFLINNLAEIFASVGINTAILDMTKNKNSYYIYTRNEETLRKIAYTSIEKLKNGMAEGIKVKQNLTVYTALPNDEKDYSNAEPILSTLVQNHSLVLIDCDFETNPSYFASCQEIYLVQSMDILTIQPLTAFLRDLKTQGVLEPEKVRVVINKEIKVKGLENKAIIGGMSFYNDPAMSFMTELFNKDVVKYCNIPFEEMAYSKYLGAMLNCKVSVNGYSKNFMNKLRNLGDMVYPLTSRQTYSSNSMSNYNQTGFSSSMNNTLSKMKKKY